MKKNRIILIFLLTGLIVSCRDKGFAKENEDNGNNEFPENLVVTLDMQ